jgi:hypothetical protein
MADAGTILKIAGDAGGCDDDSDASKDGRMGIEGDAGGGDGDYGESGTSGPDGLDPEVSGRDARGDGNDIDGGEDDSVGLRLTPGPFRKSRWTSTAFVGAALPQLRPVGLLMAPNRNGEGPEEK